MASLSRLPRDVFRLRTDSSDARGRRCRDSLSLCARVIGQVVPALVLGTGQPDPDTVNRGLRLAGA